VKRSVPLLLALSSVIVMLDFMSKRWVSAHLAFEQPIELLGPYVRLTYTRNSGVAFGLGAGTSFPFYIFSIVAAGAILYLFLRSRVHGLARQLALAMILGGALGNLIDRVRFGEVVDFIQIGTDRWYWPVFNVADAAVSVGVVLFALTWSRHSESRTDAGEMPPEGPTPEHAEDSNAGPVGAGAERGGTAGPIPGGGAGGSLS
jgi:signal peptidase II